MFQGCTALVTPPESLPAVTLSTYAYSYMFSGCTHITYTPTMAPTTINTYSCQAMFYNCSSLTTLNLTLPATTLKAYCYAYMFKNCTSLTAAPVLPAATFGSTTGSCDREMFMGCSSMNYIKALFTTKPTTTYTSDWVKGVAATGTFVKKTSATWSVSGAYGSPSGWTIIKEDS